MQCKYFNILYTRPGLTASKQREHEVVRELLGQPGIVNEAIDYYIITFAFQSYVF